METTEKVARPRNQAENSGRPPTPGQDHSDVSDTDSQAESYLDPAIEIKRLREVARYYCSAPDTKEAESVTLPSLIPDRECAVPGASLDPIRPPELSVDAALTAFAQLGALKLDCDRAFISIIDREKQYILAEATKTISLEEKNNHADGDAIYLGRQALPIYWGVCPGTVQTFTDTQDKYAIETSNISANKTRYVIRNFMEEQVYRDRPYVAGWPFMRFYAEVPVLSPRGMVIGSYCVVDNKPRRNFGDPSVKVLEEIATSISNHLELTRMKLDYDRAVKLMTGLSSFVEIQRSGEDGRTKLHDRLKSQKGRLRELMYETISPDSNLASSQAEGPENKISSKQRKDSGSSSIRPTNSVNTVASKIKQTFQRASSLICGSLELDQTAFFDTFAVGASNHPDLNPQLQVRPQLNVESPASSGEDDQPSVPHHHRHHPSESSGAPEQICEVLGSTEKTSGAHSESTPALPALLLHRLLKGYPTGHIFHVNTSELDMPKRQGPLPKNHISWKRRSKFVDESTLLFTLFPQACSIIFFPLYDSSKNQWCAACIGWTANPRRALEDAELTYLAAFSNSIVAELGRLEAVAVGQAKSDFLGFISHELRSPLHGILASTELLEDSSTGAKQTELISMVDSCGRTLLDTMNSLLYFAKINNFAKQKSDGTQPAPGSNGHENLGLVTDLDLRALVEEVVEAMFTGYAYQKRMAPEALVLTGSHDDDGKSNSNKKWTQGVVVFLDIDPEQARWIFPTEAGAWRRLVMNLLGNSLKYTSHGSIQVTLQACSTQEETTTVHLSVSDTGKGISKDYLKHKLFSPFSQEDSLAVGAGLGLSIVQQIVQSLGGTISIESELSVGTTVTISIPLKSPTQSQDQMQAQSPRNLRPSPCFNGITVCLLEDEVGARLGDQGNGHSLSTFSSKAVLGSLLRKQLQGFGALTVRSTNFRCLVPADVYIAAEEDFSKFIQSEVETPLKPHRLILLRTDTSQKVPAENGIVHLSQPFGPSKLKKALEICLGEMKANASLDQSQLHGTNPTSQEAAERPKLTYTPPKLDEDLPLLNGNASVEPHPHLLLVDDNYINLKIMCTFMEKLRCTYATAVNGLEAVDTYKSEATSPARAGKKVFDFVLMDVSMPVMDGLTATRAIRAFEKDHKRLPAQVIALTGIANTKARDEATASGVDVYLTKPVQLKVMQSVLGLDRGVAA